LAGWLVYCLVSSKVDWFGGLFVSWLIGLFVCWLVVNGWVSKAGWLVGWVSGVGWLVDLFNGAGWLGQ